MKITARLVLSLWLRIELLDIDMCSDLSYTYLAPGDASNTRSLALDKVDFEIGPGQLILITGANGSGKTTLVKLLTGMLKPSKGSVSVDGSPLPKYNVAKLRDAVVFLGQSEVIYPVSIKENITMGLGLSDLLLRSASISQLAEEAAKSAGASEIMQRLGLDTVTNPCSINGYSIMETPGRAAVAALRRYSPIHHISLTNGEQQRLIAYVRNSLL
jgi:ABC-type multidrug transport system fused ATPase/permease subunit